MSHPSADPVSSTPGNTTYFQNLTRSPLLHCYHSGLTDHPLSPGHLQEPPHWPSCFSPCLTRSGSNKATRELLLDHKSGDVRLPVNLHNPWSKEKSPHNVLPACTQFIFHLSLIASPPNLHQAVPGIANPARHAPASGPLHLLSPSLLISILF